VTSSAQTSVSTTPVRLAVAAIGLGGPLGYVFKNLDPAITVYLGPSNVTSTTGYPLAAGSSMSMDVTSGNDVWAVTASGTVTVAELGEA
jgi:hypothetical protein